MEKKEKEKKYGAFSKYYRKLLINEGFNDIERRMDSYKTRLEEMYDSDDYASHNIYPSMDVSFVYAVIAMCLELKDAGCTSDEIIPMVERGMASRWIQFVKILKFIDHTPVCFAAVRKWNGSDHAARVKDGSISYERFSIEKDKIEYRINKCIYVDMFSRYGIRPLCKIFCNTDRIAYNALTRHVRFIRHSDLSDGDSCSDEIIKIK